MGSSTGVRHERQEVSSTVSPRVESSSPVRGNFFVDFFFSNKILADLTEWSRLYLRKTSNVSIVNMFAQRPRGERLQ